MTELIARHEAARACADVTDLAKRLGVCVSVFRMSVGDKETINWTLTVNGMMACFSHGQVEFADDDARLGNVRLWNLVKSDLVLANEDGRLVRAKLEAAKDAEFWARVAKGPTS